MESINNNQNGNMFLQRRSQSLALKQCFPQRSELLCCPQLYSRSRSGSGLQLASEPTWPGIGQTLPKRTAQRRTAPMQQDCREKHALLCSHSDREDDREDDTVRMKDRKRSMLSKRRCPPSRWACPCPLVAVLCVLQLLSAVFYIQTRWNVQELQLQIAVLNKKAECNRVNGKHPVDRVKDNIEQAQVNLLTQQKLRTVESNIARVNQYVVSLKTSYEKLKSDMQGASQTQLSSLSDVILQLNQTTVADIQSIRAELGHLKCLFANVTRWICGLEEHLSSHMQNFSFPVLELIEDEMCNFTAFGDYFESRLSKGPDRPTQHVQKPSAKMGLVHSYPNTPDLTHAPLARPHLQGNTSSTDILLMKIKSTQNKYGDIPAEGGNSSEVVVSVAEEVEGRDRDQDGGNSRSTADGNKTTGFHESEMVD